jgi:class 3 adenylate cyclase/tetratricopeptide (TPR) repeat protein
MTRRERKVVTVLFADLVGFTARAEQLDPEDVEAILRPYHERLRAELERHGGTVEKFIGDAVMALFGAPIAHEDDPERAVRAALAIRDWASEEDAAQVRIAVNTGEALVNLAARPDAGEGMAAGDVVNTTARLQSAAPINGVLVAETTYRATRQTIDYREHEPVEAKGKADRVPVWEAVEARSRLEVDVRRPRVPLVGRKREVDVLADALARVREERALQLVTLVGEPGIGKSRLVYELFQAVETDAELIWWRHGRSLPYGEGVSFWALGEMLKTQAGILETDGPAAADDKLRAAVAGMEDADWIAGHLRALVGLGGEAEFGAEHRGEAFAAWRRFFEELAEQRPLVLVFEDLHWADDGLLDFVDHLVDWASGVPILVVGSARPELLERRPGWGGGKRNSTTISLSPLGDEDTARLIAALLDRSVLPAATQEAVLRRAGGNPLYAEEFARILVDRGAAEDVPETLQGMIAARLDGLAAEEKLLLQHAAVVGKVFWLGALEAMDGASPRQLEDRLHGLERKEFVRRERRSSVEGDTEYAFLHVLVRDVAYGQIPRAERTKKHEQAAHWIESLGRPEDHAEMLAHHYECALELRRLAGQETDDLAPRVRLVLRDAGDRARGLAAFAAAARFYREAFVLWPESAQAERADLLYRLALAVFSTGGEGWRESLEDARSALLGVGDRRRAAEMESLLAEIAWVQNDGDRCHKHVERALELVRDELPSPEKARVLSQAARFQMLSGELGPDLGAAALELAELLELDEIRAHVLITIGTARAMAGDLEGWNDVQQGLDVALAGNLLDVIIRGYSNLATIADFGRGDLREALRLSLESERFAEKLGSEERIRWARGNLIAIWRQIGEWDMCLDSAEEFLARSHEVGPHYQDSGVLRDRSLIRLARGDLDGALEDEAVARELARAAGDPQTVGPLLGLSAWVLVEAGRRGEAEIVADEVLSQMPRALELSIDPFVWAADALGLADQMRAVLEHVRETPWREAAEAVLTRDFERAALLFDQIGTAPNAALARLRAARALIEAGRRSEGDVELQKALAFWRSVGAKRYVAEGEALLAVSA